MSISYSQLIETVGQQKHKKKDHKSWNHHFASYCITVYVLNSNEISVEMWIAIQRMDNKQVQEACI